MSSIDIVIPCYRYGRYLRECVQSVLAQEVRNCRILIIDDESPDETPQVAQALADEDARITWRRHAANKGHISTYNEGIDWCESDYMLLLSADDYLLPGALTRAMAVMDAHPDMGLCFGGAVELHASGTQLPMPIPVAFHALQSRVLEGSDFIKLCADTRAMNIVPTPTAVVRTALLKQIGAYRADLPHSADMELWLRIAAHGQVGVLKADQAIYRRHAANMSSAYYEDNRLADLLQREVAFDAFLASCAAILPNAAALHRRLMRGLSSDAVTAASVAFNDGREALCDKLCALAARLDPAMRQSREWRALAFKRLIGLHASNALRPIAAKFRWLKPKDNQG
jgi:glycosyltransferase involved in cell wall biosynthesis